MFAFEEPEASFILVVNPKARVLAKRQEAENALENRERVKKIRQYIENQIEKQRIGAWRLQLICGRI